ncbi:hypothetical protein E2C01_002044 [Portunus trituberculatus]|uniref:Uncharacterized protein n=1 Tax=Portunus trituberculatus TaxID=210409 RepID=A0A5B7CPB0_PORTR|nr:hypothetical protein [Portunus trituberculatus]
MIDRLQAPHGRREHCLTMISCNSLREVRTPLTPVQGAVVQMCTRTVIVTCKPKTCKAQDSILWRVSGSTSPGSELLAVVWCVLKPEELLVAASSSNSSMSPQMVKQKEWEVCSLLKSVLTSCGGKLPMNRLNGFSQSVRAYGALWASHHAAVYIKNLLPFVTHTRFQYFWDILAQ